ncbi:MAG TPA: transcription-repair coupling factor, partial [Desulfuromonadaceae bacterium]
MTVLIPQIVDIRAALARGERTIRLPGLQGSAPACVLAELLRNRTGPFLVITADQEGAEEFCRELGFFAGDAFTPLFFPAWDSPPFAAASPHPDISGARLDALFRLHGNLAQVVVLPVGAAMQRVLPRRLFNEASCYLVAGEEFERDDLLGRLVKLGYANVPLVEDRGTFAVRGGILDIFPPNFSAPVRIEFMGDTVETMRSFDPLTQRSLQAVEELVLLPSREILLTDDLLADIAPRLKACCDDLDIPADRRRAILEELRNAVYFQGIEYLQPLLHPDLATIFDYAPSWPLVLVDPEAVREAAVRFGNEVANGAARARAASLPHAPPGELFLSAEELDAAMAGRSRLELSGLALDDDGATTVTIPCE